MPPAGTSCGIPVNSDTVTATVIQFPAPVVSISGAIITVTSPDPGTVYTWQWKNGSNIWADIAPSVTGNTYTVNNSGYYRVKAAKSGCESFSAEQYILLTSVLDPVSTAAMGIRLFPNPVHDILTVDSLSLSDKWQTLEVIGFDGTTKQHHADIRNKTKISIPVSHFSAGTYMLILRRKEGKAVLLRFMKL